jgi:Zn-dependent peptidase ImmA (M78 family)
LDVIKPYKYYSKENLETIATELRLEVEKSRKRRIPSECIAEAIADYLKLDIIWESLTPDSQGDIAAMIVPIHKKILINENIDTLKGEFGQSTIAHEIGHWKLHINQEAVGEYIDREQQGIKIEVEPFLCRSVQSSQGIEWQAQYFASCLLMPNYKLIEAKKGRDVTRWRHLYAMADEFGVTISNLTNRLKSLGWIIINNDSKQIYPGKNLPNSY